MERWRVTWRADKNSSGVRVEIGTSTLVSSYLCPHLFLGSLSSGWLNGERAFSVKKGFGKERREPRRHVRFGGGVSYTLLLRVCRQRWNDTLGEIGRYERGAAYSIFPCLLSHLSFHGKVKGPIMEQLRRGI